MKWYFNELNLDENLLESQDLHLTHNSSATWILFNLKTSFQMSNTLIRQANQPHPPSVDDTVPPMVGLLAAFS